MPEGYFERVPPAAPSRLISSPPSVNDYPEEHTMADQKNWRSKTITGGVARAPNRAMLRAVGFKDGDFDKPIVGVANGHSTLNPCNGTSSCPCIRPC